MTGSPVVVDAQRALESLLGALDYTPEQLVEIAHIRLESALDFQRRLTAALAQFHSALEQEQAIRPEVGD